MNLLYIRQLEIKAYIGIHPHEQQAKQSLFIDLELEIDIERAAKEDNINEAINYQTLAEELIDLISHRSFALIETVAKLIADYVRDHYHVKKAQIRVSKPNALKEAKEVGIILSWPS